MAEPDPDSGASRSEAARSEGGARIIDAKAEAQPQAQGRADGARSAAQDPTDGPTPAAVAFAAVPAPAAKAAASRPLNIIRQYELVDLVKAYDPKADEDLLNRAYVFAMKAHGGQTRKSGDPYFTHPLAVAEILTGLRADPATVATALLHDVVEDTDATIEDIERLFGTEVAQLVAGVTKLSQLEMGRVVADAEGKAGRVDKHLEQFEQFRRFVVAMAADVRVLLVKLADRLHNMRTLHFFDDRAKRERIAQETMEIYAPLAGRIGVHQFREELEDLAFSEINPLAFEAINNKLRELGRATAVKVALLGAELRDSLARAGIRAEVKSREKRPYSIWRKMSAKNVPFERLADIYAFRVLVDAAEDCYRALGVIHQGWRMVPEEFDDYISAPKPNGYRSIHTAVVGPPSPSGEHQRIEIQIRTREMHELAERGAAAHWQYKDKLRSRGGEGGAGKAFYDPYETPRRLAEMLQQGDDPEEALRYAKLELFHDQVFCFTPKGQVIALPKGATSLDFAYAVHTDIGDQFVGAKINGARMPLRTPLKNSDVVEIDTSLNAQLPSEWETLVTTGRARSAIRRRIKRMEFEDRARLGRDMAESVFAGAKLEFSPKAIKEAVKKLLGEKGKIEDVLARVGGGEISVNQLVEAAYPGAALEPEGEFRPAARRAFNPRAAIIGLPPRVPVRVGRCCAPVPGERIVGVKDEDGAITVHAIYCETWARDDPPESRLIDLGWSMDSSGVFGFTQIVVTVRNEVGVLSEAAAVIARYGVSIANIKMRNHSADFVDLYIDVEIRNERQLAQMLAGLRSISTVISAERREAFALEDE